ncbi:MAG UNVERIFIED_CONTAM: WD40 domain-containing protein [Microcystis novacekii LVE1205-3]
MTQSLRTFKGHQGRIWSVVFSSDGQRLASSSDEIQRSKFGKSKMVD